MKVRFQADADLNEDIVSGVIRSQPGVDFQTAGYRTYRKLVSRFAQAIADGSLRPRAVPSKSPSKLIIVKSYFSATVYW